MRKICMATKFMITALNNGEYIQMPTHDGGYMALPIKHTVVLGAGALGSFYGSRLYEMDKTSVSFIASGERYDRLKAEGVLVNGDHYPIPVIKPQDDLSPPDLIIVALKHHQLKDAVEEIGPVVGYAWSGEDSHYMAGLHFGIGF